MENITHTQFKTAKAQLIAKIHEDLLKTGRCIVRDLGTFKVVKHKAKVNNLGKIPARKLVKFTATIELKNKLNK